MNDSLYGIKVKKAGWLPATMKDKDGIERELLGIMQAAPRFGPEWPMDMGRLTILLGEPIRDYQI